MHKMPPYIHELPDEIDEMSIHIHELPDETH